MNETQQNEIQQVFYAIAGSGKGKLKTPFMVYEQSEDAKEYANNYTDMDKEPKVIKYDINLLKLLDLTNEQDQTVFETILNEQGLENQDVIEYQKQYFDDAEPEIANLDTLVLKKIFKTLATEFDVIKGFSMLDNEKVISYSVLNAEVLTNKEIMEIDLEGDLWKVEFKK